jgi:hypothetical protein
LGGIYGKHENGIKEEWNENIKKQYEKDLKERKNEQGFPIELREHMDLALSVKNEIKPMQVPKITEEKVKRILKRLKNKEAAGLSGLKPEFLQSTN